MQFFLFPSARGRPRTRRGASSKLRSAILATEQLESRALLAVSPFTPFTGKDTNDQFMVPRTKVGDPPNPQWNMEKVRAADVWWVYDGSPKSVVAVEDYGIDFRHEDFGSSALTQGQLWDYGKVFAPDGQNFEFSKRGRDDFHYVVNPPRTDTLQPGWVEVTKPDAGEYFGNIGAGIIGAKTNNNLGVAGINWDVQMYSAKVVVGDTTNHDFIAMRANRTIQYLRMGVIPGLQYNPNPQLIRAVSFGYCTEADYGDIFHTFVPVPETEPDGAGHYDFVALGQGIQQTVHDNGEQGILVTVPTGDDAKTWPTRYYIEGSWAPWKPWTTWDPNYPFASGYGPGDPDNILAVAATDINDKPWSRNASNPIDIYAPGVDIVSIGEQPRQYVTHSGTREAQAHVAGAISLLYDVASQHGFTPTYHQVREAIIEGGDDIGLGKPRLNIVNAIKYLSLFAGRDLTRRPDPLSASLSLTGGSRTEGDVGVTPATFQLQLTRAINARVIIGVKIEDGTAMAADRDFTSPNAAGIVMVTIPAGAKTATFSINVNGDRKVESNEAFVARIVSTPSNVTPLINGATATWTILNDDLPSVVSLSAARALEGSASVPGTARVFATLDKASVLPVTVQYSVIDGSAAAGSDFRPPVSNVVTFQPGTTSLPIDIRLIGDAVAESDETFQVRIESVVNGTAAAGGSVATVTVMDDDRVLVSVQPAWQAAVLGGTATMLFTVTLNRASTAAEGDVQVSYRTIDGAGVSAAIAAVDYQAAAGTIDFQPGETSKMIAVTILPRRAGQRYPKSFSLELSAVSLNGRLPSSLPTQAVVGRIT